MEKMEGFKVGTKVDGIVGMKLEGSKVGSHVGSRVGILLAKVGNSVGKGRLEVRFKGWFVSGAFGRARRKDGKKGSKVGIVGSG